ncbi:MAG: pantetheine-phosphate adenylyltransferase [Armatimonadota bacterium]
MRIAVYPGSFDPITNGHLDIINRASKLVDKLIVAVVENPAKQPLFTLEERLRLLDEAVKDMGNVQTDTFRGLLVDFLKEKGASVIVKGLRAISDFEFEYQMALMNKKLEPSMETIFLMTSNQYAFLSSSSVREISAFGGNIRSLVPPNVEKKLAEKFETLTNLAKNQKIEND